MRADELAARCVGHVLGDSGGDLVSVAPPEYARSCDVTWGDSGSHDSVARSGAGLIIIGSNADALETDAAVLVCPDPLGARRTIVDEIEARAATPSDRGAASESGRSDIRVAPSACIGPQVSIGAGTWVGANCVVEAGAEIGTACRLGPGSVVGMGSRIDDGCRIGAGALVGTRSDAYHWVDGGIATVPGRGIVVIGRDVDLGPGANVQRGVDGATVIGPHSAIGSQAAVGHDSTIGAHVLVGAQSGVAAGCVVGDHVVISVQVGINVGVSIGDRAQIGAKSGVMHDVPAGETWWGLPAQPKTSALRQVAVLRRLAARRPARGRPTTSRTQG